MPVFKVSLDNAANDVHIVEAEDTFAALVVFRKKYPGYKRNIGLKIEFISKEPVLLEHER